MKIAIMQPYIFPYIGYFQLINAVDIFVIYDDVSFIKGGYVNRNSILSQGKPERFNLQMIKSSSNKLIKDIRVNYKLIWQKKLLKKIKQNYSKAEFYKDVFPLLEELIEKKYENISEMVYTSLLRINEYLEISTKIIETSAVYNNKNLSKVDRIIDICNKENILTYVNPIGGKGLYKKNEFFEKGGIILQFLKTDNIEYLQFNQNFVPNLSIIDVMMFNSKNKIKEYLELYTLI